MNVPPHLVRPPQISPEGFLRIENPVRPPGAPEATSHHPCIRIEKLDKRIADELDPLLLNDCFPFWSRLEGPTVVHVKDVEALRVIPCEPGTEPTANLCLDVDRVIVTEYGVDDSGEVSEEWVTEGRAAARSVLVNPPPRLGLPGFREEREVRIRQCENVARWYGLAPNLIAELTGRPYEPRKGMLPACGKAKSLSMARAKERAQAERAAAEERTRLDEERRPAKTLGEHSLTGVAVPHDGLTQVPLALQTRATFVQGDETIILWPTLSEFGLELPHVEFAGCRVLPADFAPAIRAHALDAMHAATVDVYGLTLNVRRRFMKHDRGPIAAEQWTKSGEAIAKNLAARWAHVFYTPLNGFGFVPPAVMEALVRGLLLRPDHAAAIAWAECLTTHARIGVARPMRVKGAKPIGSTPAFENVRPRGALEDPHFRGGTFLESDPDAAESSEYRGAVSLSSIKELAVAASIGGETEPGCLLPKHDEKKKARDGK
ncbi:MAG TPA: hypothetical protein VK841_11600 [Polyangiaceae bacterium]|nr:hypothetical protein [Polyangiaceae bacterium]